MSDSKEAFASDFAQGSLFRTETCNRTLKTLLLGFLESVNRGAPVNTLSMAAYMAEKKGLIKIEGAGLSPKTTETALSHEGRKVLDNCPESCDKHHKDLLDALDMVRQGKAEEAKESESFWRGVILGLIHEKTLSGQAAEIKVSITDLGRSFMIR